MVTGLSPINLSHKTCEGCLFGKQARKNFKNYVLQKAKKPLEVVYSDVCGPLDNNSLRGNTYFLTFVDEFTRKIWIYLLKEKSEMFERFVKFCAKVERQSGYAFTIFRTDVGREFNFKELEEFCVAKGIEHEVTTPYTPQHNGIVERRNRTLLDMERCMLKGKGLPHSF